MTDRPADPSADAPSGSTPPVDPPVEAIEVELSILAEARNEVGAADHKASMVLAVLGIGFGALLAGLIARDWSPTELDVPGRTVWYVGALLADTAAAAEMAMCAAEHSWSFTWAATAARLRRICDDLTQRTLVDCA